MNLFNAFSTMHNLLNSTTYLAEVCMSVTMHNGWSNIYLVIIRQLVVSTFIFMYSNAIIGMAFHKNHTFNEVIKFISDSQHLNVAIICSMSMINYLLAHRHTVCTYVIYITFCVDITIIGNSLLILLLHFSLLDYVLGLQEEESIYSC